MATSQERDMFRNLVKQWLSKERAKSIINQLKTKAQPEKIETPNDKLKKDIKLPEEKGFVWRLWEDVSKRWTNILDTIKSVWKTDPEANSLQRSIAPLWKATQIIWQWFWAAWDVVWETFLSWLKLLWSWLSKITPDSIEEPIKQKIWEVWTSVLQSEAWQLWLQAISSWVEAYWEFKKENPETAKNIEAIWNILSFTPIWRGGKPVTWAIWELTEKGWKTLVESWEKTLKNKLKDSVTDLIVDPNTKKEWIKQVTQWQKTAGGLFFEWKITPTKIKWDIIDETNIIDEISKIKWIQASDPIITKTNKVRQEISNQASKLEKLLDEHPVIFPRKEINIKVKKLVEEIKDTPLLKWADISKQADNVMEHFNRFIAEQPSNAKWLLTARKNFDKWIKNQWLDAFEGVNTWLKVAIRKLRMWVNDIIADKATDVPVKDLLKSQQILFMWMEKIAPKALKEAWSWLWRLMQRVSKFVWWWILSKVVAGGALAWAGTAAVILPTVWAIASWILWVGITWKLILSPKLRKTLWKVLDWLWEAIQKTPWNPDIQILKQELEDFLNDTEEENITP